jgi:hypothetical protein
VGRERERGVRGGERGRGKGDTRKGERERGQEEGIEKRKE